MDEIESLGKYLKREREFRRISLREVAKSTRVREHILRAIEADQHDLLPPATYVKGFLMAYAKYLRIDPNEVLLRYERMLKGGPSIPPTTELPKPKQKIPPTQPPTPRKKILWNRKQTWMVGGAIVASLAILYFFSTYSSKPPIEPVPEKSVSEEPITGEKLPLAPSPSGTATTSVPPLAPSSPATAPTSVPDKKLFSLRLKAIEETWVNLQVDDQSGKEMTLKPGESISVQASNRIRMILGNAGGLDLILNGKALEKFGKSGETLTLIFTSQGVEVKPGLSRE